jgi:hypothetical protein
MQLRLRTAETVGGSTETHSIPLVGQMRQCDQDATEHIRNARQANSFEGFNTYARVLCRFDRRVPIHSSTSTVRIGLGSERVYTQTSWLFYT